MSGLSLLQACGGVKYLSADISGSNLLVPLAAFEIEKANKKAYRHYLIAQNEQLEYPICIYRLSDNDFSALLMRCTHQGTELQVFGDRLQCTAHGSEFSNTGAVQNGPADKNLRQFPCFKEGNTLKIDLS